MAEQAADQAYAVAMRVGGALFTLLAEDIDEVMRSPLLTRVPHCPEALEGVTNLRGVVLPVFSLALLLGLPRSTPAIGGRRRVVVLRGARMGVSVDDVVASGSSDHRRDQSRESSTPLAAADLGARAMLAAPRGAGVINSGARARSAPEVQPAATQVVALLGFELAGQAYALPLSNVEEVLRMPAVSAAAASGVACLGMIDLRGAVLPLMSLRVLLGLPADAEGAQRHVVLARLGETRIGFAVDALAAVIRAPEHALSAIPAILNRGGGEARIASIYRAGEGRLVSVLSPDLLFADKSVVQARGPSQQEPRAMPSDDFERREQIVVFRLGDEEYGLPIVAVEEITRAPQAVTRVPNAPGFIDGVMNLRGRVTPLIDLARRFGVVEKSSAGKISKRVIVTRLGETEVGFVVDGVTDILSLTASQTPPTPAMNADATPTFDRVAMLDVAGRMILLVDPKELLDRVERDMLQELASQRRDAS